MARVDKLLEKWRQNLPKNARVQEVEKLLNAFGFECHEIRGGSSHLICRHKALETRPDVYGPDPHLTIPRSRGGKYVKGFYIKKLLNAIDLVIESRQEDEEDEGSK